MTLISIIGSGRVGVEVAKHVILRGLGDVVLVDIIEGLPQGEALDLGHMASMLNIPVDIIGTNDYRDIEGSDIVVITAGSPRKPGMTREELIKFNAKIVKSVSEAIKEYASGSKVIVVTNPVEPMVYTAYKVTGFNRKRILGFGALLDTARYKYYIARRVKVSPSSINALVIGQHGEYMLPLPRLTYVHNVPLENILSKSEIEEIIRETVKAGARIIELKKWSASHAVGPGVAIMVESILKDERNVLPIAAILDGEYGVNDIPLEVPAVVGANGIEKIVELNLTAEELEKLRRSIECIKTLIQTIEF